MKNTNFSKNELEYMRHKEEFEKTHTRNYVYNLRHTIRRKLKNMVKDVYIASLYGFNDFFEEDNKIVQEYFKKISSL